MKHQNVIRMLKSLVQPQSKDTWALGKIQVGDDICKLSVWKQWGMKLGHR